MCLVVASHDLGVCSPIFAILFMVLQYHYTMNLRFCVLSVGKASAKIPLKDV